MKDPWNQFTRWMAEAEPTEPRVPEAMQLATVGPDGCPSIRTVLLKEFDAETGLVFFTNYESRKAKQLLDNPHAAICLHFKGLERQILAEGPVTRVPAEVSTAYHASRPRGSQLGAWASHQSDEVASREDLIAQVAAAEERFAGGPVPRPPFWGGYSLMPNRLEFWQGRSDRIHHRDVFERVGHGWRHHIAQP